MKNEQTIKSILEAIERAVDGQINEAKAVAQKEQLKENVIMDLIHQFAQMWNDTTPLVYDGTVDASYGGMTHGEAFRYTLGTILGFGGSIALAAGFDKIRPALMKAPGKIKKAWQAFKALKKAKTGEEAEAVMSQFGAKPSGIQEARQYALKALFEATKADKASFTQVKKGEGKGGAKQDNEIKGKKPSEKKAAKDAEDWKDVDAKTETKFGSKPTAKKPQDASKETFKKVGNSGEPKGKKMDTKPSFGKVSGGKVKGGAKSNVDDVKKK